MAQPIGMAAAGCHDAAPVPLGASPPQLAAIEQGAVPAAGAGRAAWAAACVAACVEAAVCAAAPPPEW